MLRCSLAQTASAAVDNPASPSTTIPSDSNLLAHPDWNQQCRERAESVTGKRVDLLFLGDSITQNWTDPDWGGERRGRRVWAEYYAQRHALNFGVGADKTQNLLWRMDHMPIAGLHPRVAVIMVGVNNYEDPPEAIAAGIKAILDKTRRMYPGIKIIQTSILPNRIALEKTMEVNTLIHQFADDRSVLYLDLVPLFIPQGDNWVGVGADHLHPNETGYRIWAQAMEPMLDRLMPSDRHETSSFPQTRFNPQAVNDADHVNILRGLARLDMPLLDPAVCARGQNVSTGQFRPIVAANRKRLATLGNDLVECPRDPTTRKACVYLQRQTLTRERIDGTQ